MALAGAAFAALQLARAQAAAISSVRERARQVGDSRAIGIFQLEDSEVDPASFAVDCYLDAARRAQNSIWPYLSKVLGESVPKSLADIVKSPRFPGRIDELILDYWESSGQAVKQYRDLAQHHAVVSSDGRVTLLPDGGVGVYLVLPNNPAEKEPGKLAYLDPRIDALPWVWESYWHLYAFVYELTHVLTSYVVGPKTMLKAMRFKGALRFGVGLDAHEPIATDHLITSHMSRRHQLEGRLDSEMPRSRIEPTLIVEDRGDENHDAEN